MIDVLNTERPKRAKNIQDNKPDKKPALNIIETIVRVR